MGSCQSIASNEGRPDHKQKGKPQIIVKTFTWSRDSHGLFDYESKSLTKKTMKSTTEGTLVRMGNDIFVSKENDNSDQSMGDELIKLNIREGNFWVTSSLQKKALKEKEEDWEDNNHSLWLVVKSFKSVSTNKPGYKLTEGDLIKLGRIKFRVKELRGSNLAQLNKLTIADGTDKHLKTEEDMKSNPEEELQRKNSKVSVAASRTSTVQTCRICLGEQGDGEDPFFSPCQCSGTMKYIHVLCLQKWLKSKLHVKQTGFSTSVYWKTLECELCKTTYPSSFDIGGKRYDIVEVERPDCGYLMLEILSKEKNILRGIHIIKMEGKNNILLGRGHDCDIRITDISVSRCHALIKLDKGNFYLEDNNSKFGTLIHMKRPFPLFGDFNNISIQVGRTVLSVNVKKNWKSLPGCFGSNQVRNPTEIEDEEIFSKISLPQNQIESNPINRHQTNDPHNIGPLENMSSNREEQDLPSPINHEDQDLEEDQLSHLSDEEYQGEDNPENQQVQGNQNLPENQLPVQNLFEVQQLSGNQASIGNNEIVVENIAN